MSKAKPGSDKNGKASDRGSDLPPGVRRHDFRVARKLNQTQRIWMGALHSRLAANLVKNLEQLFHCECETSFLGLEQTQGSNFAAAEGVEVVSCDLQLQPGGEKIYLTWPREMIFFFLEKLLGGAGDELFTEKELSAFEQDVIRKFMDQVYQSLQTAFETPVPPTGRCVAIHEGQVSFSDLLPYEVLMISSLNVRVNGRQGKMTLIYPYSVVKSWVDETAPSPEASVASTASPLPENGVVQGLAHAPVGVKVRMRGTKLKFSDFASLQVGDCVLLSHSTREPFDVYIDRKMKFHGHLGAVGRQLGIKLIPESEQPPQPGDAAPGGQNG